MYCSTSPLYRKYSDLPQGMKTAFITNIIICLRHNDFVYFTTPLFFHLVINAFSWRTQGAMDRQLFCSILPSRFSLIRGEKTEPLGGTSKKLQMNDIAIWIQTPMPIQRFY